MAKGTPSFGKRNKKTHIHCRPFHYNIICGVLGIKDVEVDHITFGTAHALPVVLGNPAR
jgi:hypothetical protein